MGSRSTGQWEALPPLSDWRSAAALWVVDPTACNPKPPPAQMHPPLVGPLRVLGVLHRALGVLHRGLGVLEVAKHAPRMVHLLTMITALSDDHPVATPYWFVPDLPMVRNHRVLGRGLGIG